MERQLIPNWGNVAKGINFGNNFTFNTTYPTAQVNADLSYLASLGFQYIRVGMPNWDTPVGITNARLAALAAKTLGFYVTYGVCSGNTIITLTNWSNYAAQVLIEAAWAQANNIDEFSIGNELELHIDGTTLTETQMRINLRALAVSVKAIYSGKVIYNVAQGFNNHSAGWITDNDMGVLDYLGLNVYGDYPTDRNLGFNYYISQLVNAFGTSKIYISEFNIWYTWTPVTDLGIDQMIVQAKKRLATIVATGVTRAYPYNWRGVNDDFSMKLANEDFHPIFPAFLGVRPWFYGLPNINIASNKTPISRTVGITRQPI